MVSWGSMDNWSWSILSLSIISDISNITIIVIGVIVDMLDSAIRKSNRVGSSLVPAPSEDSVAWKLDL